MAAQLKWRLLLAAAATVAGCSLAPQFAQAEPSQYVRVCDVFGKGWLFDPGSETCVNVESGVTRASDGSETGLIDAVGSAYEGIAVSLAIPNATVDPGKTFGVNVNVGVYQGTTAIGLGAAISTGTGLTFNGAIGFGLEYGSAAAHLGLSQSW
jgi:hypothetical protein